MEVADPRNVVPPGRVAPFSAFIAAVLALAVLVAAGPLATLPEQVPRLPVAFWTMAALAVVCDARPFVPPGRRQSSAVFPSTCFTFAILLGWGLGPAVAVQAIAVVVSGWRLRHAAWRTAFNVGQYACALAAAYGITRLGPGTVFPDGALHGSDVAAVGGATVAWFLVNYLLVSMAVRLRFGDRWWPSFRQGLGFELLSTGSLLLLAPVLVAAARTSAALIPLVLVPLFAVYRMARLTVEQQQLASLDPLTGLPNRKALLAEVAEQVHLHAERAARGEPDGHLALLLIDLDRFKNVNDALGHAVGDRLLVEVSQRLTALVAGREMVARLGGDEFAIVMTGLTDVAEARELADRVVGTLAEPVPLDGLPLDVGGSIGIALFPEHGEDFATLMRHADVAMYDAKHRNDTVAVYAAESDHNSAERLGLLADLRRVLETGGTADDPADYDRPASGAAVAGAAASGSAASGPAVSAGAANGRPGPDAGEPGLLDGGTRGGDGATLGVPGEAAGDGPGLAVPAGTRSRTGRWWTRRRGRRPAQVPDDELISRIVAGADPVRRRAGRPGAAVVDRGSVIDRRPVNGRGPAAGATGGAAPGPAGGATAGPAHRAAGAGTRGPNAGPATDRPAAATDPVTDPPAAPADPVTDPPAAPADPVTGPPEASAGPVTGPPAAAAGPTTDAPDRSDAARAAEGGSPLGPVEPGEAAVPGAVSGPVAGVGVPVPGADPLRAVRQPRRRSGERGADADPDVGEITMYYQPQIAIATGEVVGVEALLRWRHPRRGMVDPEELIRVAEQSAVMRLLTRRVVDDVVEQLAKWSAAGVGLRAALNVSVRDLHTGEIADQIADRLARYGVPPERLQLEITEGALMADPRRVLATISRLHRIGVAISLDDFGTGYSSLQHLRRLPLSEVKVDRSFVLGMAEDADDAAIVRSMIELAGALGLRVVAEGVEDERTWRMLHAAGCDAAQGWFYARPMPAEELVAWLARYRPVRPTGGPDPDTRRRPAR
ncbi:bifunctional diguanylate cyclase/phosphodiesterase [Micromonospora costi]|uniref:EAL domain-containing protein n=1 Tax=Micromonospora costi TaxID=1530042 RepID=A0A3B0ACC8_9ACTN|nr:bifunctional diguanylate cyclase/phosphodiesterase [Micromonospora costi]RKN58040.1 EAL domain-containing protein [Micromonospora costi]